MATVCHSSQGSVNVAEQCSTTCHGSFLVALPITTAAQGSVNIIEASAPLILRLSVRPQSVGAYDSYKTLLQNHGITFV